MIWERNHQKWQSKTVLPLVNLSWLSKGDNGCLGCLACKLTKQANEYGNYEVQMGTNFSNVKRHAKRDQHQLALVKLGLIDVEDEDEEKAPSQEAFLKVAAGRLKGPIAWRHGEGGVGGRKKVTNMVKCLSQAMFEADRRFLARAGSIVLHMDVRALKLMIRFRAANSKLEGRRGILGIVQLTRTTATVLQAALKQALRDLCTGPFTGGFDEGIYKHIIKHIEVLDMDAASDEQCSAREIKKDLLTGVKAIMKDKAHGSRRVLSRPWAVIPDLAEVWGTFVGDKTSVIRMIQKSDVLSAKFQEHCAAISSCPVSSRRIKNLAFKKQRFDSVAKPLGRGIIWLEAIIATAIWASIHRRGEEDHKNAESFLSWVNEKRLVLLAMCADARDCALSLVRAFDTEEYDPSLMQVECDRFLSELHYLFNNAKVTEGETYTKYMISQLQSTKGFLVKGEPKTVGGAQKVTPSLVAECIGIMRLYVSLAVEVVRCEFPQFEILGAFRIFDLQQSATPDPAEVAKHAERLCQVFGVQTPSFLQEFWDHKFIAMNECKAHGLTNVDAWVSSVRKTSSRPSLKCNHPSDALRAILMRFVAYHGCCTSGVEQSFSKLQNQFPPARDHMIMQNYLAEAKVVIDFNEYDKASVGKLAQQCWTKTFGTPRASCKRRLDTGVPRKRKAGTVASLAEKRRKHLHDNVSIVSQDIATYFELKIFVEFIVLKMDSMCTLSFVNPYLLLLFEVKSSADSQKPSLSDRVGSAIQKEISFQKSKYMKSQLEAFSEGVLLESEVPQGLREAAIALRERQAQNSASRHRDESRLMQLMNPMPPQVQLSSAKAFLENTAWKTSAGFPQTLTLVADPWHADLWVAEDPEKPPVSILWHAAMKGGHVVNLAFVKKGQQQGGVSFTYGAAIATKRLIFVEPNFETQDPEVAAAVKRCCRLQQSKWKLLGSWTDFARATDLVAGEHLPVKQRRMMEVLALTTERVANGLNRKSVCTKKSFLLATLRVACTKRDICGH